MNRPISLKISLLLTGVFILCFIPFLTVKSLGQSESERLENEFVNISRDISPAVVRILVDRSIKWDGKPIPLPEIHPYRNEDRDPGFTFELDTGYWKEFKDYFEPRLRDYLNRRIPPMDWMNKEGSGMIISSDGYILTANHTIEYADTIKVFIPDKRQYTAQVVGRDKEMDIALLKISATQLPKVVFGNSSRIKIGQWAIAFGYPGDDRSKSNDPSITIGHIGGLNLDLPDLSRIPLIQVDAQIRIGFGGGPLINRQGEVIGMVIAKSGDRDGGIGYAIPINEIKSVIEDLMRGKIGENGWLGILIEEITPEIMDRYNFTGREGVLVNRVIKDSPADKARILVGDIILEYNGTKIETVRQLQRMVGQTPIGEKVNIRILRNGQEITITAKIEEREISGKILSVSPEKKTEILIELDKTGIRVNGKTVKMDDLYRELKNIKKDLLDKKIYVIINLPKDVNIEDVTRVLKICRQLDIGGIHIENL